MPAPVIVPSNTAEELFPDTFRAEAIDVVQIDATTTRARAFEPVAFTVAVKSSYESTGLVPPLELIVAAPSGRHERTELVDIPIALVMIPNEAGTHRVTVREVAHNRWWGGTDLDVDGETS